jgi:hypothetical protein
MIVGLQLKYLWSDVDVIELRVIASNGIFSGGADLYAPTGGLAEAASTLQGFPANTSDVRELQFGAFGSDSAGGGANLRFSCKGGAGHAVLEFRVESEDGNDTHLTWNRPEQSAHFFAEIEACAIDDFVAELRKLEDAKSGIATLRFAQST